MSLRRRSCWVAGAATALLAACGSGAPRAAAGAPRIAAEFERLAAVWLGWDSGHGALMAELAALLERHVPLKILVRDAMAEEAARAALLRQAVNLERVRFERDPLAIYFLRDAAVFTTGGPDGLGVIDFKWTQYGRAGWCERRHAADPARRQRCSAEVDAARDALDARIARLAGARLVPTPLAMEGGGIEVNGQGLMIANEALFRQRNPGLPREAIELELLRLPGMRKVIWLPAGLAADPPHRATITGRHVGWGTGGHTDEFVRFADARTVLLAWPDAAEAAVHPVVRLDRECMQRNLEILERATDTEGRPLRVLKLPMPSLVERPVRVGTEPDALAARGWSTDQFLPEEGRQPGETLLQVAVASYLNFVVANGVVVLPDYVSYGTPPAVQGEVRRIVQQAFPGRQVRFVDALGLNWLGGGAHCTVLPEPER